VVRPPRLAVSKMRQNECLKKLSAPKRFPFFESNIKYVNGIIVLPDDGGRGAETCSRNATNVRKE